MNAPLLPKSHEGCNPFFLELAEIYGTAGLATIWITGSGKRKRNSSPR
jgi:hypothetical protein